MFVFSVKISRRQLLSLLLCVVVLLLILVAAFVWPAGKAATTSAALHAADGGARVDYLQSLGYEVDPTFEEVREVLIPDEFDEVFAAYNAMQQEADMDLLPYHGKRLKCWSYRLTNAASDGEVLAHLYVYDDEIVGGDISETVADGATGALLPRAAT